MDPIISEGSGIFLNQAPPYTVSRSAAGAEKLTLNLLNAPITQAAKTVLGDILKVNYTVSDKVGGKLTIQTTNPVPKDAIVDIFESALKANGAAIVHTDTFYRIVPLADAAQASAQVASDGPRQPLGTQARVVALRHISATDARRLLEPVVPPGAILRIDDTRGLIVLSGTARELDEFANLISIFDVDWLKGMSFALLPLKTSDPEIVAKELESVFGLDKDGPLKGTVRFVPNRRLGSVLVISSRPDHIATARSWVDKLDRLAQDTEEQLHVYKIQNRSATELAALLSRILHKGPDQSQPLSTLAPRYDSATISSPANVPSTGTGALSASGGGPTPYRQSNVHSGSPNTNGPSSPQQAVLPTTGKVVADEANNALLVTASQKEYQQIHRILRRLDVLPTQVMLEALIAEVTLNDELKFGVKWFFEQRRDRFTLSDAVSGAVASTFPGFSYFFSTGNVRLALDAISSITNVNVVSAPSLMVLDNRKAILQVGDQVPIVTQTAQNVTVPGGPVINSITLKDTGVILAITPRVNDAGRVILEIEQEVSNVARTTSSGIDSPTIQQRRIKTTVVVVDGEVLALGGLIQERDNVSRGQVPILGSVPILGTAFRSKSDSIDRTELIIFIRPIVVRDSGEARAVSEEFRNRINLQTPTSQRGRDHYDRDATRILR